jgi:hypothetical protein
MNEFDMAVIAARCEKTKQLFGMSFRAVRQGEWYAYWAFPLTDVAARQEGYDCAQLVGNFYVDSKYPGCPYCGGKRYFRCGSCGHLVCWDDLTDPIQCSWCGNTGSVSGTIQSLSANQDL